MKLWQFGVFAYGIFYFVLACAMEAENLNHSYPIMYVLFSMIAQTLVVCGVFLFGLEASPDFARMWRWIFPLLVLEVIIGIVFDATIPADINLHSHAAEWLANALFGLWLASPAYYFNFKLARYRG